MADATGNENEPVIEEKVADNTDYIKAIEEMKQSTVSKEDYLKLKEENKQLLKSLVNGEKLEEVKEPAKVDLDELRDSLFNKDNTNLDYVTKALKLRAELLAMGEKDPFLPYGHNIVPTDTDIECANRVAEQLQNCVDIAEGNPDIFTNELQRIMVDTAPQFNKRR